MSHGHGNGDVLDRPLVAASAHVSNGVKALVLLGAAVSIMQGFFVTSSSGFGRVWPAADSAKLQLPPMNLDAK